MSSTVKAAVISAVVFLAIIVGYVVMSRGPKAPVRQTLEQVVDTGKETDTAPPEPEAKKEPLPPVVHETVPLTVEVLEKGRKRRLPGSQVVVFRASEGDRPGPIAWDSGKNTTGFCDINTLEPGAYQVRAQCPRYKGEKRSLTLIKGTPQSLVFELEKGISISGRVLASDQTPVPGARVVALEELAAPDADLEEVLIAMIGIQEKTGETAAETLSDQEGRYQLDGLHVQYYTVQATATGFAPGGADSVPAPREKVDIILQKGGEVGGIVRDIAGRSVSEATVKAYPHVETQDVFKVIMSKARPPVDTATTDAQGVFQFKTLGAGIYNFLVQAKGYQQAHAMKIKVGSGTKDLSFSLKPGATITGIVRGPSDELVSGAKVRATLTGGSQVRQDQQPNISFDDGSVYTDDQGRFTLDTLEEGTYILLCWHQDFQTLQRKDVRPSTEDVILKLSGGGRIKGRVSDPEGQPVAGARLSAQDTADLQKQAVTQEDGTFLLTGLGAGTRPVSVSVSAAGYARQRREVKVRENAEVEENFELQPTGTVSGLVRTSSGDPISGARVMVRRTQESGVEQTLGSEMTDAEGRYAVSNIEAGPKTWVRVKKAEYLDGFSEEFDLEASQNVEVPPLVLQLGGAVGGRVLAAGGEPVSGCMVYVLVEGETDPTPGRSPSNSTNARGEFIIQGLKAGTVDLFVQATRFQDKKITGVPIREGEKYNTDIQLDKGNSVSGRVVDGKGQPVSGADVSVRDFAQGAKELKAQSDDEGKFTVEKIVAADTVELSVQHENYGSYSREKVPVNTSDLEVVLKALGSVVGRVLQPDGQPAASFSVVAQVPGDAKGPRKQLKAQTYSPADGTFEYRGVPGGVYTFQVRAPEYAAASIPGVRVQEGDVVDLGVIELQAGGIVAGRVVDAVTQKPVAGARVQITQGASRFAKSDPSSPTGDSVGGNPMQTTDASGSFRYTGLKPGNLSLRVSQTGYITRKVDEVNPEEATAAQNLVIELESGGEITGTVLDKEGKARGGMPVYLITGDSSTNQTAQTDRQGRFKFTGVPSGSHTVKAYKFGSESAAAEQSEQAVELGVGDSKDVTLQVD